MDFGRRKDVPVYRIERIIAPDLRAEAAILSVGLRRGDVIAANDPRIERLRARLRVHGVMAPLMAKRGRQRGWIVLSVGSPTP